MRHILNEPTRSQTVQVVDYVTRNFQRICHLLDVDQNNGHSLRFQNEKFVQNIRRVSPASMPVRYFVKAAERSREAVDVFHGQLVEHRALLARLRQYAGGAEGEAARWAKRQTDKDVAYARHNALVDYQIRMGARVVDHWIDSDSVPSFAVANMVTLAISALDLVVELSGFTETPLTRPVGDRMTGVVQSNDYWTGPMKVNDDGKPIPDDD